MDTPSDMKVKDLFSSDSFSWNISRVTQFFGEDLSKRILAIPIVSSPTADVRLWQRSSTARAPVGDLAKFFRPQALSTKDAAWIWSLPTLPRIQLFIWKLLWDCLPTSALLSRRGVPILSICPLCGLEEETTDHAIFGCSRARLIWHRMGYPSSLVVLDSPRSYFLDVLRKGPQFKQGLWAATAYQIWLSRNQLLFSEDLISPERIVCKIRAVTADCASALQAVGYDSSGLWGSSAAAAANRHTVFISWEPPPPGFVKINFDGSVRGRLGGSAFIIRGPQGQMLAAGGFGSLGSSVPMTELYAAWVGITYAYQILQAHRLVIEGDSLTVIRWLRKEMVPEGPSNPILRDIWSILQAVDSAQICHIFREANSAADWAAAYVAQHAGYWVWSPGDPCSLVLSQILISDVSGLVHTRLV